jgi:hypothetical protein
MLSFTVTLTDADTNYSLKTLVEAILATYQDGANMIIVQAAGSNTSDVLIGDTNLAAAARIGLELSPYDSFPIGPSGRASLVDFYARSAGAAQKLNILVQN